MTRIQITVPGIKKALGRYSYCQAIAEYIWNGFDAKATSVELSYQTNSIGFITEFSIKDNGYGIPFDKLATKFVPFFESEKVINPNEKIVNSANHGKNGVGRLTFFHFATIVKWDTIYESSSGKYRYQIETDIEKINTYTTTEVRQTREPLGTSVSFEGITTITSQNFDTDIKDYLLREFCWFLELNSSKHFSLKINGKELNYSGLIIGSPDNFIIRHKLTKTKFDVKAIQWDEKLNDEYSRYYFVKSNGDELFKEATTLNNKGDHFYHSVYIKSSIFDSFNIDPDIDENQKLLFGYSRTDDSYKYMKIEIDKYLKKKRKPYLKAYGDKIVANLENDKAFPTVNPSNIWELTKQSELKNIIKGIYQIEPKIFSGLNKEQEITLVGLLSLVMDSNEKDRLFIILQEVVELDVSDREELAELLKVSRLSAIISTIKLIQDRYKAVVELKELIFNVTLKANEKDHIQKMIEKHYWLFGEQFHLVTAAEPKFEQALSKWHYLLTEKDEEITVDHPDKRGEMDIFTVRQDLLNNKINSVIVELKSPQVHLGKDQYDQVLKYLGVITKQPECNGQNMFWEFYLVGKTFDTSGYIDQLYENAQNHGEPFLVFKAGRTKIYIKKWSEIFSDFELRHKFLNDKLEIERDKLLAENKTADDIVDNQGSNSVGD